MVCRDGPGTRAAIRDAGGDYELQSEETGDYALVWAAGEEAGYCSSSKGLRGLAAVAVALHRATVTQK